MSNIQYWSLGESHPRISGSQLDTMAEATYLFTIITCSIGDDRRKQMTSVLKNIDPHYCIFITMI